MKDAQDQDQDGIEEESLQELHQDGANGQDWEGEPLTEDQAMEAGTHNLNAHGFPDVVDEGWCRARFADKKGYMKSR